MAESWGTPGQFRKRAGAAPDPLSSLPRPTSPFRTDLALLLFIGVQPLESAVNVGSGNGISATKLAGVILLGCFVLDWSLTRRRLVVDWSHAILIFILVIALMSAVLARSPEEGLATLLRYAGFVLIYVILTQFTGDHRLLLRIAWVLSAASSLAAILALYNFLSAKTLIAKPTYGDANDLAYMIATTLPFTVWLLRQRQRIVGAVMLSVLVAGLVLTLSRGAMIAIAAGSIWFVLTERRSLKMIAAALAIAVVSFVVVLSFGSRLNLAVTVKRSVAASNVQARLDAWRAAVVLADKHPVLGVGPGSFPSYYPTASGTPAGSRALVVHNAYLEIAAELGIPALALFLVFLMVVFLRLTESIRFRRGPPGFAIAARTSLVIAAVGAVSLSEQYFLPLWLLAGLATVLWLEDSERSSSVHASSVRVDT